MRLKILCYMRTLTFPSPTGDLYFSINTTILNVLVCQSFRPLPGTYISQWRSKLKLQKVLKKFPSPTGDLYFSMVVRGVESNHPTPFPSPTGDLYFSIVCSSGLKLWQFVSVPYRGLIFLNLVSLVIDFLHNQFPSPTGDLYFSIVQGLSPCLSHQSFRPLPGTYISQWHCDFQGDN